MRFFIATLILFGMLPDLAAAEEVVQGRDSYRPKMTVAADGDALPLLQATHYKAEEFEITISEPQEGDAVGLFRTVRFDSPRKDAEADVAVNRVVLEWFAAEKDGKRLEGPQPAVLVLHTLDSRMLVGRGFARGLASKGIHTFMMHSPGYGQRQYRKYRGYGDRFFERGAQAVSDTRRSRDAIAALPGIDVDRICLQGTSLGGFYATAAGSLDDAFAANFIFLAGANLYDVFTKGQREAAWVRESMAQFGIDTDEKLKALCRPLDPEHAAHRMSPHRTWLFNAKSDQVVPPPSSKRLAEVIGIKEDHHTWLAADHYTGLIFIPQLVNQIAEIVHALPPMPEAKQAAEAAE